MHLAEHTPIDIVIDAKGLQHADLQGDHLHAEVSGSLENHALIISVNDHNGDLSARLTGEYINQVWHGKLAKLIGKSSQFGHWALENTSSLEWHAGAFSLANFSLVSRRGERVTLEITDMGATTKSQLALHWYDLHHDRLTYIQPSLPISGSSSGEFALEMIDQQPVSLRARLSGNASLKNEASLFELPVISADMSWLDAGLNLNISAGTDNDEHFTATASSSQPPSWQWPPEQLSFAMDWQNLDLGRLSGLRQELKVTGRSEGHVHVEISNGVIQKASAEVTAEGQMHQASQQVGFRSLFAKLDWDENNFRTKAQIQGVYEGLLSLKITSTVDPGYYWPDSGDVEFTLDDFDLRSFVPFLPVGIDLIGAIKGKSDGYWREDGQVFLAGQFGLVDDEMSWSLKDGQIGGDLNQADLEWQWQGHHLEGMLMLQMDEKSTLQGRWRLPFSVQRPVNFATDGPIEVDLKGFAPLEKVVNTFAPDIFQDVRGQIETDMQITGTLQAPQFSGMTTLTDAGVYLPITGVTLDDVSIRADFRGNEIHLGELSLASGEGELNVSGLVSLDRWKLEAYRFAVKGERLQIFNFPEFQLLCSPDLTISGDLESTRLRGSILIPEMNLVESATTPEAVLSEDVVISDETHTKRDQLLVNADIQVVIELGDQVMVNTAGVETRLEGELTVADDEQHHLAAWGEIRLVDGFYKAYGTNLEIKQGLLRFDGDPIVNPKLKVFAARDIGRVQAGVHVTGTAEAPVVTLASRPAMPERDILGYLIMGRPMKEDDEGGDALAIGTGALLPNYGETFSDLGVVEVDVDGLINETGGVRIRKRLSESWEISSILGHESGVDLFYILDFD